MVFCLSAGKTAIHHVDVKEGERPVSIGSALARSGHINERRVYQLLRAEWPADMVQLRRLIAHAEPYLNWPHFAQQLCWWNKQTHRQLLEDFVLTANAKKKSA